jgi:ferredoxin-nitrate reductase
VVIKKERNRVIVEGDKESPVNKGMLCSKGMNLHHVVEDRSDRILFPEMRWARNLPRQRVSWDTALDRAAAVFKTLIQKYGPDSVGFYVSGQCLTEEYYLVNKLTKGFLGTNNIDTNSRLCMSSAVVGYKTALGEDAVPLSYEDIELADCFFITGANPAWCHPIVFRRLENYKAENPHVKIIVADPRRTQTCSIADLHLQLNPGTDITLYHAIGRYLIESNKVDYDFILGHTEGFEEYRNLVMQKTIQEAADICGVPLEQIITAGKYIGDAKAFITMWAMGLNQSVVGVNKNVSLINLNLITGQIGKPGAGPFSLTGQPNAMGGREVGGLCNMLPAHRNLDNPAHREEVAKFWGVNSVPEKPGYSATEMFDNLLSGKMKAIWIICTNPSVSLPDARNVEVALKNARFVVVQDISFRSDTVPYADLVLPAAGWMEKEGTMTNSERRITYLSKVIDAPGEALPDTEILCRFAKKMGFEKHFDYKSEEDIYKEHCALTKGTNIDISGLSYEILKRKGSVQWPYPQNAEEGTKRLFEDKKFYTPSGKARISSPPSDNLSEKPSEDFPLVLTTGRIRDQWHTMTRTGKVKKLNQHIPQAYLEIHEMDALIRGIKDGSVVEVFNPRGSVKVTAKFSADIKPGVVFLPMHWGKILNRDFPRANNLTNNLIDPKSKEPDLKFSAVEVRKVRKKKEKILIAGAGAGAWRFITRYRELNPDDEIEVFCSEPYPFYNRVMLPEYVSGKQDWEKLMKATEEELRELCVKVYTNNKVISLDSGSRTLVDAMGDEHSFDKLILATGSRATLPKDLPQGMQGIFSMRYRADADKLKSIVHSGQKALIVGGGLLGLEMADSLLHLGVNVSIVQRVSRLMDRQLDVTGSALLDEEMKERGVEIFYNDEVLSIIGKDKVTGVRLKSGRRLDCDIIIYAIGTTPNIEIAKEGGLKCNRGVVVNDYLQTSHPDIFALGEIAEYKQTLYGITAAAEEQAEKAADFINGNPGSIYEGSLFMNILKVYGLNLCSIGMVDAPPDDPDYQEVIYLDKARRYYKKCIVYKDRLEGAILIGDKSEFNEFRDLIKNKIELSEKRLNLILKGGGEARNVIGKLVCSCNNVGEGNLMQAIEGGCVDLKSLCQTTGAGTGCGSCKPELKALLEKLKVSAL